ncbi:MAG TPA: M20/M25/M40 family metallo-hydrolase [Thermoanaerobaculaceae bacterium]|nr:M20/M25/M40 family metallo-hydrolase [Thermoanaerobaculaceae bacterium]
MRKPITPLALVVALCFTCFTSAQEAKPAPKVADDFVSAEPHESVPAPLAAALSGITAPGLAASIAFLASPALEGRGLGTRGLDAAAEYVAASLALAGVPPLAGHVENKGIPETYFQEVPIREITGLTGEVTVEVHQGEQVLSRSFASGVDCLFSEMPPQSLKAPVVFAGYGIREEKLGRDDYRGLDVRGKIVLVLAGLPPEPEWQKPELVARYAAEKTRERYAAKLEAARAVGAVAVLGVEGVDFATRVVAKEEPEPRFFLPFEGAGADEALPLVRVSPVAADAILAAGNLDSTSARTANARQLPGVTTTVGVAGNERLVTSRNVVAFITGSDKKLSEGAVVIGAHMDHLGRVGDAVYPGADDNASGASALLEIAKVFAAAPDRPKRTLVFCFWTGEEEGKFGSGWWVRHPLWPLKHTIAYLNLDMIGHPWAMDEIRKLVADTALPDGERFLARVKPAEFAEPGVADWSPELAEVLRRAGPAVGLAVHLDRTDGKNGGSDYRDFARAHVPFVRFFGNFFPAYHEPGDTPDQLDPTQVQRLARFCLATAWLLANR